VKLGHKRGMLRPIHGREGDLTVLLRLLHDTAEAICFAVAART
jgi:hypothetical protein